MHGLMCDISVRAYGVPTSVPWSMWGRSGGACKGWAGLWSSLRAAEPSRGMIQQEGAGGGLSLSKVMHITVY